ncbi:MAG: hypothetical protein HBSAPP03_04100 [Phycisphaerae bacterium]|nr:MAG: hypothetical protein HBSAPP03_04100 [Phycisphaerae bacterium]
MEQQPNLIVRNSVRHDLCLRGQVRVIPEEEGGVRLSPSAGTKDGYVDVDIVDIASGGLGFISMVFFPRTCLLETRVFGPGDGTALVLTARTRVQRVCMTDRRPAYLMGCSFDALTPESKAQLASLLDSLSGQDPA